jgi:hypothetical protein
MSATPYQENGPDHEECPNCGGCYMVPSDDPDGDIANTPCPDCNHPRLTPGTDSVAAHEGNWDTKALRMTAYARVLEMMVREFVEADEECIIELENDMPEYKPPAEVTDRIQRARALIKSDPERGPRPPSSP